MEVYILDKLYRRIDVVDKFESLIWTERFRANGDFELIVHSTRETRNLFKAGINLAVTGSYRVMMVETIEDNVDADGKKILTIKGRSLEAILEARVAKQTMSDLSTEPTWSLAGLPAVLARKIFHDICVLGNLHAGDVIPYIIEGSLMPAGTIVEPATSITLEVDPTTVYAAIKDICDVWNLGFRMLRNFDSTQIYFDIYTGSNRTTSQAVNAPVIFAPELDNLQNTAELTSIALAKNVAYVFSPAGFQVVYPQGVDPAVAGVDRRVLMVKADDITNATLDVVAALNQRGREELSKNMAFSAFDGEINTNSQYKYDVDYHLGDLVEVRNIDGASNIMRVEEQIIVSDKEGDRSYPTLALSAFVTVGSWFSWDYNQTWSALGVTEVWANQ